MQAISDFFTWLFNDRTGVVCLLLGGIVICLLVSFLMERKTKQRYFNHENIISILDIQKPRNY